MFFSPDELNLYLESTSCDAKSCNPISHYVVDGRLWWMPSWTNSFKTCVRSPLNRRGWKVEGFKWRGWSDSSLNTIGWEEIKQLIFRLKLDWIITVHRIEHVIRLHDYSIYAIKSQAFLRVLVWIIHGHLHWRHTGRYRFCWWKKSCTSSGCIKTANSEINYQMN